MARIIDADRLLRELTALSHGGETPGWTYEGLRLLVERQPTLTPPNEWVSVEERLPEEQGQYIVFVDGKVTTDFYCVCEDIKRWLSYDGRFNSIYIDPYSSKPTREPPYPKVTHWMPLPSMPKEEKK